MTQEFHISVTPVGQNDYLVRTEEVASGVPLAEELVNWPVAEWLAAAGHLMNDPLKSVLQGDAMARNSVNLAALGQQLYNELFQGTLRDSWITAQGIAQNHQQVLRLRLGIKDNRLARLPWEVMHAGDRPIATGPYIAFSRFQNGIVDASRLPSNNMPMPPDEGGIRVLMVVSSPTDLVRLDLLKQEAIKLQAELHRQQPSNTEGGFLPEIQLTLIEQPGREELTQALEQGRYHVLHYSGHSNLGTSGGEIYLVSRRTGLTETLTGDDLAGLLVNNNIQMAVFNSCLGAYGATSDGNAEIGERSLTESLVRRGIRGVLAMSERIPDEVALTLTQLFYRNLSQGYSVDLCVSRVRQGLISAYGSHQMYWALPILYQHPKFDGNLSPGLYLPVGSELLSEYEPPNMRATPSLYSSVADDVDMPLDGMMSASLGRDDSELDWLGEDTWGDLVDEIEDYDDPSYAEDSAIVSDLFRQLDREKPLEPDSASMTGELVNDTDEGESIPGIEVSDDLSSLEREVEKWREARAIRENRQQGGLIAPGNLAHQNQYAAGNLEAGNLENNWDNSDVVPAASTRDRISVVEPGVRRRGSKLLPLVGFVGASAIAIAVGVNWWQNQQNPTLLSNIPQVSAPQLNNQINFETEKTELVTAYASEKLSQGDLEPGLKAVEALLNRNALAAAKTSLDVIPQKYIQEPSVNFYKGRLAWQSVQVGDKNFSIDDARRYWETAVKAQADSVIYTNALGFAFYAEGNVNRANDSWFRALSLATAKEQKPSATPMSANATVKVKQRDDLTAFAGLALGLYKTSQNESGAKREQYINEAVKLRQKVVTDDPYNFQMDKLGQSWLWNEKALQDWKALLQVPNQRR
ncbi:cell division protein HetF [Brunnivagina elsteri]|uniref:Heterocyst differentiation protein n=1 Tax=Brunnivagina elsteri CCALA 953 TaxID=987040 RepID=A0A2A2TBW7_9CYAN|nr:cell division protein HetF [Calothrix elsteri]PAX51287.1 heterocyst differentiation protein [Calothrix elsteri CCALA 953]